jgi:hypothetical protein
MKNVRTVLGLKRVEDNDSNLTLLQLREILNEQRKVLITRLLSDLPVYIDYRFSVKADAKQLDHIKEKLDSLKNHAVDLDKYGSLLQHMMDNENSYLNTALFYREIDDNISWYLKDIPLKLVK